LFSGLKSRGVELREAIENTSLSWDEPLRAYVAGLIDGEGSISIGVWEGKGFNPQLTILSSTSKTFTEKVLEKTNIGRIKVNRSRIPHKEKKKRNSYNLNVGGMPEIYRILNGVLPYLILKKEHAKVMMKYIEYRSKRKQGEGYKEPEVKMVKKLRKLNRPMIKTKVNPISKIEDKT